VPEPGNPQSLNRYTYVYNNPLRYTDPSGHIIPIVGLVLVCAAGGFIVDWSLQVSHNMYEQDMSFLEAASHYNLDFDSMIRTGAFAGSLVGSLALGAEALLAGGAWLLGEIGLSTGWDVWPYVAQLNDAAGSLSAQMSGAAPGPPIEIGPHREMRLPVGDELDSHHVIQDAWARRQDIAGYSYWDAPAVRLGPEHQAVSDVQQLFRAGYGWDTTFEQELQLARDALQAAGFSPEQIDAAIQAAEQYFASLGVQ
jgi:hypothetical protein